MNDLDDWNVHKGEPSPELETAWDDILKYRNLAIPSIHLPKHLSSIPILTTNGTSTNNLLVNLDVFHNLHCLNTIREYIFRSYYSNSSHNLELINDCVDSIRQALQCHADISIIGKRIMVSLGQISELSMNGYGAGVGEEERCQGDKGEVGAS
ncbi:tat pathway signal sequence protein [Rutstroemia sp. NJR-2017a BBW]|nr:tat pathway signal sequence protein [Rutstroemia sp. NJR-2017a BBW]